VREARLTQPSGCAFTLLRQMLPPVRVREVLEASRRAGVPFGDAWHRVLDSVEGDRWRGALAETASTWPRAYTLEPLTAGDLALDLVSRGLANELADLDAPARCPECGGVVPASRSRRERVYCSRACSRVVTDRHRHGRHSRRELDVAA
jgi:hypothetical protein